MSKKFSAHNFLLLLTITSALIIILGMLGIFLLQSANPFDRSSYQVVIPLGATVAEIKEILFSAGVLRAERSFIVLSRALSWQGKLQAGNYSFSPSDPLIRILFKLKRGKIAFPQKVRITFPEGTSIYKMARILEKEKIPSASDFEKLVNTDLKLVPFRSLEGYLFPDTYVIFENISAEALAKLMYARFNQMVLPFWEKAREDTKYSLHEILALASIIEKEARLPEERSIISSVFHNRLQMSMPLAADPTIKYALERPTKKVYQDQLEVESPYNTYKRLGLPPGPICNPGLDSIRAAVYPAKTNYLYFVAKPDGSHIFSSSWEEHQKARLRR